MRKGIYKIRPLRIIKRFFGLFIRNIVNEVFDIKIERILEAAVSRSKDTDVAVSELDVLGGMMSRKEFVKKLKHVIKLVELRKEWIDASIYAREGLPTVEMLLDLEKDITELYHKAKREENKSEIAKSEGRLEVMAHIKEILE